LHLLLLLLRQQFEVRALIERRLAAPAAEDEVDRRNHLRLAQPGDDARGVRRGFQLRRVAGRAPSPALSLRAALLAAERNELAPAEGVELQRYRTVLCEDQVGGAVDAPHPR